jgi:hypothetical protein
MARVSRGFILRPKIPIFGSILEGLGTENVGMYILRLFGIIYDHLV